MDSGESAVEQIGAYRVVRKVAGAATSEVLLAKADGPLGSERSVVLKVFSGRDGDEVGRTFAREAAAYCRLSHATVVRLLDFFALPPTSNRAGQLCMVLEHVEGPSLARLRTLLKGAAQELDDRACIHVAANIFEALSFAHSITPEAPLVHRDVNPTSVLIAWDGQVKVTDFGFAKISDASHDAKGTYGYLAPEQAKGLEPTPRADIYSAGLILWELLAKRKAFQRGALPEEEAVRAMADPRLPALETIRSDLHPMVLEVLRRTLEPRVEQRTITAEEAATLLSGSIVMDEGRDQLANALGAVRASGEASGNSLAPRVHLPERKPITSIPPPATKRGVAPPPPSSSSDVTGPVSATDPFARTTPMDAFDIDRRPNAGTPRKSVVDAGPVKGKSATQRLSIAIPDPPAPQRTLMMAPAPAVPPAPESNEGQATQPLTRTLALPDRPPVPPRSNPPLSLPVVAIAAPAAPPPAEVSSRSHRSEPIPAPVPARSNRALPVVVTLAIVGIGIVVAYTRSQPSAVRPPEKVENVPVATAEAPEPPPPTATSETALTKEDTTAAVASAAVPEPAAPVVATPASASPAPSSNEAANEDPLAADMGRIRTAGAVSGRRIFVDDKTVGQTPSSVIVKCGRHTVKLGSAGKPQTVDVPCRGDVTFSGR